MMRKLGVVVALVGIALAAAAPRAAAQALDGSRLQPSTAAQPTQPVGAPVVSTPALPPAMDTVPEGTPPSTLVRFGPTTAGAELLAPARVSTAERPLVHAPAYRRASPGVPLMIVGGALFLAGAIIDDRAGDALMVGGVVVAAIGLYQYLE